jgi:pyruvate dehydrogenase E2 component (dihydrolipoamide acetyltransferase)
MTDKVNMDVEAPASGILKGIKANPNDVIPVAQIIAYIAEPGEELEAKAEPKAVAPPLAPGPAATQTRAPEASVAARAAQPTPGRAGATPVARKIAKEKGLELGQVLGTGPGGVITKADVLQAAERPALAVSARVPTVPPQAPAVSLVVSAAKPIQLVGRRRIIADRMQQSMQQAPHIALTVEVDMTAADEARHGASFTALLVHIVARVLRKHPLVNSTLHGDQIVLLDHINIGVATDTPEGLIVPVVKGADVKLLDDIDTQIKDLAKRARAGKLTLDEVTGGTFTITNLGMLGIPQFRAIINPPEAAILAVGSIVKRPVVIDDGIHIRPIMVITCSADHRILDGVSVAKFLQDVKTALERLS